MALSGDQMKNYVKSKGLTQVQLAKLMGVTQPYISKLYKGIPPREVWVKVLTLLNITNITDELYKLETGMDGDTHNLDSNVLKEPVNEYNKKKVCGSRDFIAEFKTLADMHKDGYLSEEEFSRLKAILLDEMEG